MCGIFSIHSRKHELPAFDPEIVLHSLKHRGPDDSQIWFSESKKIALGHTRLGIMDPEHAIQPMHDAGVHITVNGEFYDFENMRSDLAKQGHAFKTSGDSELLIHLYQRYGIDCLQKLSGEFAFILWDESTQRLFAARDRYGVKPLYYYQTDSSIILASEIKTFIALNFDLQWDEENIFNLGAGFVMDPTRTIFKNVYQVPPGHFLWSTQNDIRVQEYWNFDYGISQADESKTESDYLAQFDSLLSGAVKRRLRSDTSVGCYLSGGIDSSSILAVANEISDTPLKAYTVSFKDPLFDEYKAAQEMAKKVGSEVNAVEVDEIDLADNFSNAIRHSEFVFANTHGIAKYLLSKLVRQDGTKVVLTGEGADEVLAGYPHFRQDLVRHCYADNERDALLKELDESNVASHGLVFGTEKPTVEQLENTIGMTPSFLEVHIAAAKRGSGVLSPEFYNSFSQQDSVTRVFSTIDKRPIIGAHPVNKSAYLWSKTTFPSYILNVLGDRMEMANSVEGRLPFLDHDLVDFLNTLPVEYKIRDLQEKWILRKSMERKVTPKVLKTHKHPFTAPPSVLNPSGPLFGFVVDTLSSSDAETLPYFEVRKIAQMLKNITHIPKSELGNLDAVVTMLTSLVLLKREFKINDI